VPSEAVQRHPLPNPVTGGIKNSFISPNNFYFAYTKGACFGVLQVKKDFSLDRSGTDA
jgi:hypothetical protein